MEIRLEFIADAICEQKRHLNKSDITLDCKLKEDLGLDSLDIVEMVVALEAEYDILIPDEDYDGVKTVDDFFRGVNRELKRK